MSGAGAASAVNMILMANRRKNKNIPAEPLPPVVLVVFAVAAGLALLVGLIIWVIFYVR